MNSRAAHEIVTSTPASHVMGDPCVKVRERGYLMAGESGIFTPEHVAFVQSTGCGAILVGESLVKEGDPEAAVKKLLSLA